jgi:hypothetical protein
MKTSTRPAIVWFALALGAAANAAPSTPAATPAAPAATPAKPLAAAAPAGSKPLSGVWAGDGVSLRINAAGAVVQAKCVVGKMAVPIWVDANGRFEANGYLNPVISGYRLSDLAARDRPARLSGRVKGSKLELTLFSGAVAEKKTYRLAKDRTIRFTDCLPQSPPVSPW